MAVSIRLSRQGSKKNPQFMIVAVDSSRRRDGAFLENLGHYFPKAKEAKDKIKLKGDSIQAWIDRGAQMSETVSNLLKGQKSA